MRSHFLRSARGLVEPLFIASATAQTAATAGQTTVTLTRPAAANIGDMMVVAVAAGNTVNTRTWTGSGWTEILDQDSFPCLAVYYKNYAAADDLTYSFTVNSGTASGLSGAMVVYRYAAYDAIGAVTSNTNPLIIPSRTAAKNKSVLLAIGGTNAASVTLGTPTNMTARATENNNTAPSLIICSESVNSGSTGTRSMSGGAGTEAGVLVVLKPA